MIVFLIPILLSAYAGGLGPGLVATALVAIVTFHFILLPTHSWLVLSTLHGVEWAALFVTGILISFLMQALHHARRRAESGRQAEEQLTQIAKSSPGVLYAFHLRPDGTACIPYASPTIEEIFGIRPEVLQHDATPIFGLIHPDELSLVWETIRTSATTMAPWRLEFRAQHPQRGEIWVEGRSAPERHPDGGTLWRGFLTDITERKRAAVALSASQERYRSLFNNMGSGLAYCRMISAEGQLLDFVYLEVNPAFERITGLHGVEGKKVSEVVPGIQNTNPELFRIYLRVAETGEPEHFESHVAALDIWLSISAYRPNPGHFVAVLEDITARKRAEAALRESESRFRSYLEHAPLAILVANKKAEFVDYNPSALAWLGYDGDTLKRMCIPDILADEDRIAGLQNFAELQRTGQSAGEFRLRRRDGSHFWTSLRAVTVTDDRYLAFFQDITERKRSEAGLRLQGAALEAAANAIVITNLDGIIEWVNPAFGSISGYSPAEAIGANPRDLIKSDYHAPDFYRKLWATILAGQVWRGEVTNRRKDGRLYTGDMTITPVRDEHNTITHFIAIQQDITEHKKLEAQMLRTQRLDSLGRLASGIAHDLNNILAPIMLAPPVLRDYVQDPKAQRILDAIEHNVERGASVIKQLLTFGRGVEGERTLLQLRSLVREMARIIQETFPRNITLHQDLPTDLPLVMGDDTQIHQVLLNLCVNARDAMPAGGKLTLSLEAVVLSDALPTLHPDAKPGPYVVLNVSDTGTGIAPDNLDKIFDPFFTTKGIGEGSGLGLSTVLGIVRSHHGFIVCESKPQQGTTFKVYLPASDRPATPPALPKPDIARKATGEGILVVDDEDHIRLTIGHMLEQNGYRVFEARNGGEALAVYEAHRQEIHVVITDLMMPGVYGQELIKSLRDQQSPVKIIAVSGQLKSPEAFTGPDSPVNAYLTKPINASQLLQTLRRLLDA